MYEELTNKTLHKIADEIRSEMSRKNLSASGDAASSLEIRENKLLGNDYIYYLVNGRGPGKFPPVDNIRTWVRRRLGLTDKEINPVAFLIGRKISREGTEIFKNKSKGIEIDSIIDNSIAEAEKELSEYVKADILNHLEPYYK